MPRVLVTVVEFALVIYCLLDCIQTDEYRVRNLSRTVWILLILFIPIAGPIAWLAAGRPVGQERASTPSAWHAAASARPAGPDDDPQFLAQLRHNDAEHEKMLKEWEDDLKRRESQLRDPRNEDPRD